MDFVLENYVWTPDMVADELVAATRWVFHSCGRVGPAGFRSNMPALALFAEERELEQWPSLDELEPTPQLRRAVTPQRVSQHERVLRWPIEHLEASSGQARVLALWLRCKAIKGLKFDEAVKRKGWSRATTYRVRDKALSQIAIGLTSKAVEWGQH